MVFSIRQFPPHCSGELFPYVALLLRKSIPESKKRTWFVFFVVFGESRAWRSMHFIGFKDFFGQTNCFEVIFTKVFTDQFIYCVIWAAPTTAIFYGWKNANFVWADVQEIMIQVPAWRVSFFTFFYLDYLDSSCCHSLCHALNLQISCFNLTLCFLCWLSVFGTCQKGGGIDGTRTRDLRRDRPALTN